MDNVTAINMLKMRNLGISIPDDVYDFVINSLEKLEQYRSIGTVEECLEVMERQRAKKPNIWGDGYDDEGNMIYDMYDCPNCGKSYEIDYEEYKYCPNCGQAISWEHDNP